jgi:hypothetical protein
MPTTIAGEMAAQLNEHCALLGENMRRQSVHRNNYGTVHNKLYDEPVSRRAMVEPYVITVGIMFLLWVAQWLFWSGFIGISSDEYVSHRTNIFTSTNSTPDSVFPTSNFLR